MGHHHRKHRSQIDSSAYNNQNQDQEMNQMNQMNQPQNQVPYQNPNQVQNPMGNLNMGPFGDLLKNVDMNQISSILQGFNMNPPPETNGVPTDRGVYILNTLKTFLPEQRGMILDEILKLYSLSKTL